MENNQDEANVLIARNNETGQIGAVTGQNPDGTPKMADVKSASLSDLVKFSKGQNPLEAFMSNFLRQAKNPSVFGLFKVSADKFDTEGRALAGLLENPEANKQMLEPYAVKSEAPSQEVKATPDGDEEHKKYPKVDPDKVDWNRIEKEWGITRQDLEKSHQLEDMLYNRKSRGLVKLTPTIDGEKQEIEARLSFKHNLDGSITLSPHIRKNEPQFDKPYNGYEFTDKDKEQLLKDGSISHTVELHNPKTGEKEPHLVHLDKLTNEILSIPFSKVYVDNKICNVELNGKEIWQLKNGGTLRDREIITKDGRHFKADLQYSIDRMSLGLINMTSLKQKENLSQKGNQTQGEKPERKKVYSFTDAEGNPKRLSQWYKIPMDQQKQDAYLAGKDVEVGVKNVAGKDYMVYLQFNKEAKRPESKFGIVENGKVVGFADASKVQAAINLEGKTNEPTKRVIEKLDMGQTEPKNTKQKAQQKQTDPDSPNKKKPKGHKL